MAPSGPPPGSAGGPPPQIFTEKPIDKNEQPELNNLYLFGDPKYDRDRLIAQCFLFGQYIRSHATEFVGYNIKSILDMGCGDGQFTLILKDLYPNARVVGVDSDPRAIETANRLKEQAPGEGMQDIEYVIGNIQEALPDGPFDLIYSSMVMLHLLQPRKTLELAVQRLAPGGYLWIKDLNTNLGTDVNHPLFKWFFDQLCDATLKMGRNPFVSRELPEIFSELGLENVVVHLEDYRLGEKSSMTSQIMLSVSLATYMNARMMVTKMNNIPIDDYLAKFKELMQQADTLKGLTRWPNVVGRKPEKTT